ncbi:MAG: hypothetical protein SGI74_10340 [Oligoflexia bacterium]|nr:hypothetical protein [Oligoflexia bacterium]
MNVNWGVSSIFNRPSFVRRAPEILDKHNAQVLIMGHNHQATHRSFHNGKQYINTGTWTDVTSFDPGSLGRLSKPTYAYIEYPEGDETSSRGFTNVFLRICRGKHHDWKEFEL